MIRFILLALAVLCFGVRAFSKNDYFAAGFMLLTLAWMFS